MTSRVDRRRLEGLLKALWLGEAFMNGWRPGAPAHMPDLTRLALRRVRIGMPDDLGDLPEFLVAGVIVAPLWLASYPRPAPQALGSEPLPTLLEVLRRMEQYSVSRLAPDEYPGVGALLGQTPKPRPPLLGVHARALRMVEQLHLREAVLALEDPQGRLRRHRKLAADFDRDRIRVELVLALHAFESGGGVLSYVLRLLEEARAPPLATPLAALICEARTPGSVPISWSMDLPGADVGGFDAVVLARTDEGAGASLAGRK